MRFGLLFAVLCMSSLTASSEMSEEKRDALNSTVRIDSVRHNTIRNEERQKLEILTFNSTQDERYTDGFYVLIAVELTDSEDNTYCAQVMRSQGDVTGNEYAGQDLWELHIPHGELPKPEITAYVIQYGVMDGEEFVPFAEEMDDAESLAELTARCQQKLSEEQLTVWHSYLYRDFEEELETTKQIMKKQP